MLYGPVTVRTPVCHKPIGLLYQAGLRPKGERGLNPTLYYKAIRVSLKTKVFPCGTLFKTLKLDNFSVFATA